MLGANPLTTDLSNILIFTKKRLGSDVSMWANLDFAPHQKLRSCDH